PPPPPSPTHRIHSFLYPPFPSPQLLSALYYTLPRNRATHADQTESQNSPSDPVANPATDRGCRLFPPPPLPLPMGSADRSEIDGVVVAEKGARSCVECRATTTPMWRSGPTGPRSLCNACGIRYRKKRRQELGLDHKQQQQQNQQQRQQHNGEAKTEVKDSSSNSSSSGSSNLQAVQKRRLLMGVEEAALLLMTLSSSPTSTLLHG
uniref:GATA-type domain-containing protein n=1 Tax=Setaria italica TaxID=4555 RepID=K3XR76_SETIT